MDNPKYHIAEWEGHPEVEEMLRLQRAGMGNTSAEGLVEETPPGEGEGSNGEQRSRRGYHGDANKFTTLVNMED